MLCDVAGVNGRQRKAKTSWVVHFIFHIFTVFISLSNRLFLWSFGLSAVGAQWTNLHIQYCVLIPHQPLILAMAELLTVKLISMQTYIFAQITL